MSTTSATPEKCCNCNKKLLVSKMTDQHGNKYCGPCFKWMYGSPIAHAPTPRYDPRPKIYC